MNRNIILTLTLVSLLAFTNLASAEECSKVAKICVEGAATKTIEGYAVQRDCWKYREIKRCSSTVGDNCAVFKSTPNCEQISSVCIDKNCTSYKNTYICDTLKDSETSTLQCGSSLYCSDGNCEKIREDKEADFKNPVTYLESINQTAKDTNSSLDDLEIFSGINNSCHKAATGYNNCCSDDGWGQNLNIASCNADEKALIAKQQKGLCHYVGEHCSQKIMGKCVKTTKSYCCFNSKISRVITEQGRDQLGINWGSSEAPDCRGFTPEELQSLRFDQMNLTEITNDIVNSLTLPNSKEIEDRIKKSVKGYEKNPS